MKDLHLAVDLACQEEEIRLKRGEHARLSYSSEATNIPTKKRKKSDEKLLDDKSYGASAVRHTTTPDVRQTRHQRQIDIAAFLQNRRLDGTPQQLDCLLFIAGLRALPELLYHVYHDTTTHNTTSGGILTAAGTVTSPVRHHDTNHEDGRHIPISDAIQRIYALDTPMQLPLFHAAAMEGGSRSPPLFHTEPAPSPGLHDEDVAAATLGDSSGGSRSTAFIQEV